MLILGTISAVASCITGYVLAGSGEYSGDLINVHQWMGISVAVVSLTLMALYTRITSNILMGSISGVLVALISITGHLGGSLTHGADYLSDPLSKNTETNGKAIPNIPNIQDAFVYENAIQPLLKNRCYSCHGNEKQKGNLRLDQKEYILKGGKGGKTLIIGNAEDSELIKRIMLPINDEDHMAPKEKPQLTQNEVALLKWWIDNGADFSKKFKDIQQSKEIKTVLSSLENGQDESQKTKKADIPTEEVSAVKIDVLKKLTEAGAAISPVAQNTNYLTANFINVKTFNKAVLSLLRSIDKQLLWLKMDNDQVSDQTLEAIKNCKNLTRLSLNRSKVTDAGLSDLKDLSNLESLSLVGTQVTKNGIIQLKMLQKLRSVYLYQTAISKNDIAYLVSQFPKLVIDTGNYRIPQLAQDTTIFKAP
nr:c-type cytochrome domain-containing protein [Pedobacter sp. Leaf132]